MEQDVPELSVHVIEDVRKCEERVDAADKEHLVYQAPRLFRKSLIFKTMKLFAKNEEREQKVYRPLKEK